MAKVCKNLQELRNEIMKRVNIALDTDVADTVRDVMTDHIIQDVYDVHIPRRYERRFNQSGNDINSFFDDTDNTGLLDPDNIITTIDGDGNLIVQNVTLGSRYYYIGNKPYISKNAGKPIAGVIETGQGYDIDNWEYDGVPRPFIENTREDLKENHYHTKALKEGLKKQGLEVK